MGARTEETGAVARAGHRVHVDGAGPGVLQAREGRGVASPVVLLLALVAAGAVARGVAKDAVRGAEAGAPGVRLLRRRSRAAARAPNRRGYVEDRWRG